MLRAHGELGQLRNEAGVGLARGDLGQHHLLRGLGGDVDVEVVVAQKPLALARASHHGEGFPIQVVQLLDRAVLADVDAGLQAQEGNAELGVGKVLGGNRMVFEDVKLAVQEPLADLRGGTIDPLYLEVHGARHGIQNLGRKSREVAVGIQVRVGVDVGNRADDQGLALSERRGRLRRVAGPARSVPRGTAKSAAQTKHRHVRPLARLDWRVMEGDRPLEGSAGGTIRIAYPRGGDSL